MAVNIRTKTARAKLEPRREPYWYLLSLGVSLGFRKGAGAGGTWIGRRKGEDAKYLFSTFGSDAAKEFDEVQKEVAKWASEPIQTFVPEPEPEPKPVMVSDVCAAYVANLKIEKGAKPALDAQLRFERLVYPEFCALRKGETKPDGKTKRVEAFVYPNPIGDIPFANLKPADFQRWRDAQLSDIDPEDEESYNRAKDSINRNMKTIKAAFNYGKDTLHLVSSDIGWKSISMFKKKNGKGLIGARREGFLTKEQRAQLLAVMPGDLKALATALLLIGCRPGELAAANVNDFDRAKGKLVLSGKTGERTVTLSTQAVEFFTTQTKGRIGNAPLMIMENGKRWQAVNWGKLFREARELAKMPDAVMYCMRHTYISEAIAQGMNANTVANQTGTSVEIIQSNYWSETEDLVARLDRIAIL
jgi:integrase